MLEIVANYHRMSFQGKRMIQTHENGEKSYFEPDSCSWGPNLSRQIFFN